MSAKPVSLAALFLLVALPGCGGAPPTASEPAPAERGSAPAPAEQVAPAPAPAPEAAGVERTAGATPEDVVHRYIEAQRRGDDAMARVLIHPPTSPVRIKKAAVIPNYKILSQRVLTEADALEIKEPPPRLAGDVEIKVWEEYAGGRTSRNDYYVREFPEGWKLVALKFEM
jgi:hypothetical protein